MMSTSSHQIPRVVSWMLVVGILGLASVCGSDGTPAGVTQPPEETPPPPPPPEPRAIVQMPNRIYGEEALLGAGRVQTWIEVDERSGNPVAVGTSFTDEMLAGLPGQVVMLSLEFPQPVREQTLFDHVLFDWNPQGHGPPGVYNVPHFDFHFYMIPRSLREAIAATDPIVGLPASYIPPDYVMDAVVIPEMGLHWFDATAPEWTGSSFSRTFIWVSHDGEWVAIEPMITLQYLMTREDATAPIRQPERYQRSGAWPTEYVVEFDAQTNQYDVYMGGLVLRTAD